MAKAKGRDQRQPWIKWYTRDWRSNAKLRMCSYAARGLWADLITLMAESPVYGFLLVNNVVPSSKQLAGLLGGTAREIDGLMEELGEADVYSMTSKDGVDHLPENVRGLIPTDMPGGVIFSRRMLRDKAKSDKAREDGKGGGNPALRPTVIPQLKKMGDQVKADAAISGDGVNHTLNGSANPQNQNAEYESSSSKISTDPARDAAHVAGGSAPRARPQTSKEWLAEKARAGKHRQPIGNA